jgi:hypothetical protein
MNALKLLPRRIFAFVARDFRLFVSYRMQCFLRIISILAVVTTLFFISKIFAGFTDPQFSQWRDPLASWLTGLAVLNYFMTGFSSLANSIRQEQMQGTLESVLLTPINLPTVSSRTPPPDTVAQDLRRTKTRQHLANPSHHPRPSRHQAGVDRGSRAGRSAQPLFILLGFLVVLLPFSLWVFGRAVRRVKREGSLIQY